MNTHFFPNPHYDDVLSQGDAFDPAHDAIYQDMSQPLHHYYIASSHNTYLMEDQLKVGVKCFVLPIVAFVGGFKTLETYVSVLLSQ